MRVVHPWEDGTRREREGVKVGGTVLGGTEVEVFVGGGVEESEFGGWIGEVQFKKGVIGEVGGGTGVSGLEEVFVAV